MKDTLFLFNITNHDRVVFRVQIWRCVKQLNLHNDCYNWQCKTSKYLFSFLFIQALTQALATPLEDKVHAPNF